jgi:hypothetical protein
LRKKIEEEVIITTEITSIHPDFELTQEDVTETEQEMPKKGTGPNFFEDLLEEITMTLNL